MAKSETSTIIDKLKGMGIKRIKLLLGCVLAAVSINVCAQTLDGTWSGSLPVGLRLVLHINGSTVTMDSPDQGANGMATSTNYISCDTLSISIPQLMLNYTAKLTDGKLAGDFVQGGYNVRLILSKKEYRRPQTPVEPLPYTTEEVRVPGGADDVMLAGTLSLPKDADANTPVVVMVTGSGKQNRDEELFGHRPFAVIADYLARNGVASLRYDDRGFAGSTGSADVTTDDNAADAAAVMEWLKKSSRFGRVGILGHSEGGVVAYILGSRGADFIVSVSGPAVKGDKISHFQNVVALRKAGVPESAVDKMAMDNVRKAYESPSKWVQHFLSYDPAGDMKKVSVPAFLIYGEKDMQVPPSLNAGPAQFYIPAAKVKVYPGLNHLMQHSETGNIDEYAEIEETFSREVLEDIRKFISGL